MKNIAVSAVAGALLCTAALVAATPASAAFATGTLCSAPGAHPDGLSVANMKLNGVAADDCFGLVSIGGDVHNEIANINQIGWGSFGALNWLKDDNGNGGVSKSFLGMTWTLNAENGANNSTYTLTVVDNDPGAQPNLPFYVDIVGFLKAGPPGAFYFFDDRLIDTSNDGTFTIVWTVGNGNNPGLSGLTLFIRESDLPPPCGDCFNIEAPEPGSLALLGVGIVALATLRRRRAR